VLQIQDEIHVQIQGTFPRSSIVINGPESQVKDDCGENIILGMVRGTFVNSLVSKTHRRRYD
jgi:hypothetical protein